MPSLKINFSPATVLRVNAIGQPGERTFYVQVGDETQVITLLVEKVQVQALVEGIQGFLLELRERIPDLSEVSGDYDEAEMRLQLPIDPLFRVGEMSIGYDVDTDRIVLALMELVVPDEEEGEDQPRAEAQFWCERSQVLKFASWAKVLLGRGRPAWSAPEEPTLPMGRFSSRNNGHKH